MAQTIVVSLPDGLVETDFNPVQVRPGDLVTWVLPGASPNLTVEFSAVRDLTPQPSALLPTGPLGPLVSLTRIGDSFSGRIANFPLDPDPAVNHIYRFIYKILNGGTPLDWVNPIPGVVDKTNGGGIDVPSRPPT